MKSYLVSQTFIAITLMFLVLQQKHYERPVLHSYNVNETIAMIT